MRSTMSITADVTLLLEYKNDSNEVNLNIIFNQDNPDMEPQEQEKDNDILSKLSKTHFVNNLQHYHDKTNINPDNI